MSNIRSLPPATRTSNDHAAVIATRIALLALKPVATNVPNNADMTMDQRLADMAFRLGYLTGGLEVLSQNLDMYSPEAPRVSAPLSNPEQGKTDA